MGILCPIGAEYANVAHPGLYEFRKGQREPKRAPYPSQTTLAPCAYTILADNAKHLNDGGTDMVQGIDAKVESAHDDVMG